MSGLPKTYKGWTLTSAHDCNGHAYQCYEHRHYGLVVDAFLVQEARFGTDILDVEVREFEELHGRPDGPE